MNVFQIIKLSNLPIIIFGAGVVGEVLLGACKDYGVEVDCICDNNSNKVGQNVGGKLVVHPSTLKNKYADAVFLISVADIADVMIQLDNLGYLNKYGITDILRNYDVYSRVYSTSNEFADFAVSACINCQDNYLNPDLLFMRSVDIVVTERCSLKCKDCSNLMRYYSNPVNYELNNILTSIDNLCDAVDEINEFRVIGGEPFMHREVHKVIENLIGQPKVRKIVIYTNGTIVPTDEQLLALRNEKIFFFITDYGELSRNLTKIKDLLIKNNIKYYIQKAKGWTKCADIVKHERSFEDRKFVFETCCVKNTFTLMDGKLFRCPFSANAHILRAAPDFKKDYVGINNKKSIRKKISELIRSVKYLGTCDYCNGRSFGDSEIVPAIQQNQPIQYLKYKY